MRLTACCCSLPVVRRSPSSSFSSERWMVRRSCRWSRSLPLASAERVFAALGEVREAWPSKPFALAAHGGGRKRDQVTRQAKALGRGVAVAVATPGRVLRLLEEGHVELGGLEVVVLDLTIDRKLRDLLALPETRRDLFGLIQKHLMPLFGKGGRPRLALCRGGTAPKGPKAA
mmetsp:Transcript_19457/g.61048  ORF Transcript_19457/g.61048 Transcript_19457/m.61048 type:complete len:173 (+) Transcript_19457:637-1155(+)